MKLNKHTCIKLLLGLSGLATVVFSMGCDMEFDKSSLKMNPIGIYECKPGKGHIGPIYQFNSEDDRTRIILGSNPRIEFYDMNSKETRMVSNNSELVYTCQHIKK